MRYLYLSFILILSHLGMAQNLSKEEFVKAVNTIGVYCVTTSLSGNAFAQTKYVTIEDFEKEKQADLNKNTGTNALLQEFKKFRDLPKPAFSNLNYLKGLGDKNIFSKDGSHDKIAEFFAKTDRKQSYQQNFSEILKLSGMGDKNNGVTTDTTNDLPQEQRQDTTTAVSDPLPTPDVENDIVTTPTTEPIVAEVGFFELKPLSVGALLGTVLGFLGAFFLLKKVGNSDKKEEDSKYKDDRVASSPVVSENTPVSSDLIKYQEDIKKLKEINDQLRREKLELDNRLTEMSEQANVQPNVQVQQETLAVPREVVAPAPTKSVKYYSIPNQDGIFIAEKSRESSIYSVEYINDNEGIFYIDISERYLQDAIFEMSTFIDCGCEYTTTPSSSTKGIRVLQTGSVTNESGNWRIVEKCKIEFV